MSEITFDEDKTFQQSLEPETIIPKKGFEGWFFKKFPGGYLFKKSLLYGLVIVLFCIALFFIALGRFNIQTEKLKFQDRVNNTQS